MGVGRNLAYKKSEFFKANGFVNHMKIKSGDDDLFINQVATKTNSTICFSKNSITISQPKLNFKDWFIQKRRHISTSKYYKKIHKVILSLFYCSNLFFWGLSITLLLFWYYPIFTLVLVTIKLILQFIIYWFSIKKLGEKDVLWLFPFLEIFLITFQLIIFVTNIISKPKRWK